MNLVSYKFLFFAILILYFNNKAFAKEIKLFILPFENLSSNAQAFNKIYPLLTEELKKKGFTFYDENTIKKIMKALEIKDRSFILKSQMEKLYRNYGIEYIMIGSVFKFLEDKNPKVSLHARIIKLPEMRVLWSGYYGKTGDDYESFFGLRKIKDIMLLSKKVLSKLFSDLNKEGLSNDITFKKSKKIAIFPFRNLSQEAWVGKLTTYLLLTELTRQKDFQIFELGEIIEFMRNHSILPLSELSNSQLEDINLDLGADYVILGSVDDFREEGERAYYPEVVLALRLIATQEKKIIFMDDCYFTGISSEGIFERGRLRLADTVTYECVKTLVNKLKNKLKATEGK